MQETIEEEMRGGSFDSPTADYPSRQLGDQTDEPVVCRRPSDSDGNTTSPWKRETADMLRCRSSSSIQRRTRTRSVASVNTDSQLADRCAAVSMPNVRWICDATVAAAGGGGQCVCDATDERTSVVTEDSTDRTNSPVRSDAGTTPTRQHVTSAFSRRCSVERRISRSDPDVLKLPPTSSMSNCHEHQSSSSLSLDRSRHRRSLRRRGDMPQLLPVYHQ